MQYYQVLPYQQQHSEDFGLKADKPLRNKSGVYKFICDECGLIFITQTRRAFYMKYLKNICQRRTLIEINQIMHATIDEIIVIRILKLT